MLCLEGPWKDGDMVELVLDMRPRRVYANPKVSADAGRIALQRGPLVYCAEEADNGKALLIPFASGADCKRKTAMTFSPARWASLQGAVPRGLGRTIPAGCPRAV